jgi:hypothetical protein
MNINKQKKGRERKEEGEKGWMNEDNGTKSKNQLIYLRVNVPQLNKNSVSPILFVCLFSI